MRPNILFFSVLGFQAICFYCFSGCKIDKKPKCPIAGASWFDTLQLDLQMCLIADLKLVAAPLAGSVVCAVGSF